MREPNPTEPHQFDIHGRKKSTEGILQFLNFSQSLMGNSWLIPLTQFVTEIRKIKV